MPILTTRRELLFGTAALGLSAALEPLARAAGATPFPELTAAGSPGALGQAHGRAFADTINRNVGFYSAWLSRKTGAEPNALLALARSFAPVLARHVPEQLEEMEGIAAGSGRSRDEILLLNARSDLLILGKGKRTEAAAVRGECTALALTGRGERGRLLALGQNWDWNPALARGTVVLRLRPTGRPRLVTFTEAGMVGKIGFNELRLGVCLNFLGHKSDSPDAPPGVPVHCLLRGVLGCSSLEEAFKLVAWVPRCASANLLLAQHQPQGAPLSLDLEATPTAVARLLPGPEGLVHANHFKDPALALGCLSGPVGSTGIRDRAATTLARELARVRDPVARMKQILASRVGAPLSISKTATAESSSETLAGIVMDLSRNQLHLAAGPPHRSRWVPRPGV